MRKRASVLFVAVALLALGVLRTADANPSLGATLTGAAETGGGDADGSGDVLISLSPGGNSMCFRIRVSGIAAPTAANIYKAPAGVDGSVVMTLTTAGIGGEAIDCLPLDPKLLKDLMQHPEEYYVNVLNAEYPDGAVRGQLSR